MASPHNGYAQYQQPPYSDLEVLKYRGVEADPQPEKIVVPVSDLQLWDVKEAQNEAQNEAPPASKTYWGRSLRFWLIILGVVIAIVVVAVVLGVVLSSRKQDQKSSDASPSAPAVETSSSSTLSLSTSTSTTSSLSTSTTSSVPSASAVPLVKIGCPSSDNTTYLAPGSDKVFFRRCRANFQSGDGGADIQQLPAYSMEECINLCVAYKAPTSRPAACTVVTWTYGGLQGTKDNFCWLKSTRGAASFFDGMESAFVIE